MLIVGFGCAPQQSKLSVIPTSQPVQTAPDTAPDAPSNHARRSFESYNDPAAQCFSASALADERDWQYARVITRVRDLQSALDELFSLCENCPRTQTIDRDNPFPNFSRQVTCDKCYDSGVFIPPDKLPRLFWLYDIMAAFVTANRDSFQEHNPTDCQKFTSMDAKLLLMQRWGRRRANGLDGGQARQVANKFANSIIFQLVRNRSAFNTILIRHARAYAAGNSVYATVLCHGQVVFAVGGPSDTRLLGVLVTSEAEPALVLVLCERRLIGNLSILESADRSLHRQPGSGGAAQDRPLGPIEETTEEADSEWLQAREYVTLIGAMSDDAAVLELSPPRPGPVQFPAPKLPFRWMNDGNLLDSYYKLQDDDPLLKPVPPEFMNLPRTYAKLAKLARTCESHCDSANSLRAFVAKARIPVIRVHGTRLELPPVIIEQSPW